MDRSDRPLGREKKVVGGSAHVGRRNTGGSTRSSGGGGRSPLAVILGLLAALVLGGGGALTNLLSDSGTPASQPPVGGVSLAPQGVSGGTLNTQVSELARKKRTVLKGDGSDTTTILIYMCGTDLESSGGFATRDLQEMMAAEFGDQVRLLVFTGGCKSWKNSQVSTAKNQIYEMQKGGMTLAAETDRLSPMTNPSTLAQFIQWAAKNCPASRYELIFWDHGGGSVSGYGYDEMYPQSGSMTLDGIAKALADGGVTFDFVGFDACLMATLETALTVEPYADYLIASEETEPGCGWYYTDWLTALSRTPSMSALEIGRQIADDFVRVCGTAAPRQQATLSVMDLAELSGTLPEPFRAFSQSTSASIRADGYQNVAAARSKTKEFAESSRIDQVDLIHLADNLNTAEGTALAATLREAVKYNAVSSNIRNANGVSIYFPYEKLSNVSRMTETYDKIGLDQSYSECIRAFASLETAGQAAAGGNSGQLNSLFGALLSQGSGYSSSTSLNGEAMAQLLSALLQSRSLPEVGLEGDESAFLDEGTLSKNQEYLTEHQFDPACLTWTEKDGQNVLALSEEQWDLIQQIELNVFVDDGEGYIDLGMDNVFSFNEDGDLIGEYDKTWLCINRQIVAYYLLSQESNGGDYQILGYVPGFLNGQRVDLILSFTDENPDGEVLGAAPHYDTETETETVAKGLLPVENGDVIDFVCQYYSYDRVFQDEFALGDPLTVDGPLEIANISMDNTSYLATYRLTDIYQNRYWTPTLS